MWKVRGNLSQMLWIRNQSSKLDEWPLSFSNSLKCFTRVSRWCECRSLYRRCQTSGQLQERKRPLRRELASVHGRTYQGHLLAELNHTHCIHWLASRNLIGSGSKLWTAECWLWLPPWIEWFVCFGGGRRGCEIQCASKGGGVLEFDLPSFQWRKEWMQFICL